VEYARCTKSSLYTTCSLYGDQPLGLMKLLYSNGVWLVLAGAVALFFPLCYRCWLASALNENPCGACCWHDVFAPAMRTKVRTMYGIKVNTCSVYVLPYLPRLYQLQPQRSRFIVPLKGLFFTRLTQIIYQHRRVPSSFRSFTGGRVYILEWFISTLYEYTATWTGREKFLNRFRHRNLFQSRVMIFAWPDCNPKYTRPLEQMNEHEVSVDPS